VEYVKVDPEYVEYVELVVLVAQVVLVARELVVEVELEALVALVEDHDGADFVELSQTLVFDHSRLKLSQLILNFPVLNFQDAKHQQRPQVQRLISAKIFFLLESRKKVFQNSRVVTSFDNLFNLSHRK
jgi:hypothetical protein